MKERDILTIAAIAVIIATSISFIYMTGRDRPRCLECKSVSYSKEYCEHCGEWMNPPYCQLCDKKEYSGYKPDRYCEKCGTELAKLPEPNEER